MRSSFLSIIAVSGVLAVLGVFLIGAYSEEGFVSQTSSQVATTTQTAGAATSDNTSAEASSTLPTTDALSEKIASEGQEMASGDLPTDLATTSTVAVHVTRKENLYSYPPLSFSEINTEARTALVNILCSSHGGALKPISGSGVMIDTRGVILTNAHVAQYVLLAQSRRVDLSCVVRTGAPARAQWYTEILFVPPVWIHEHYKDIVTAKPTGTGEHDYALLRITESIDGSPLPSTFPALDYDTREAIGFLDDDVLAASYPAEFVGGIAAQYSLYPSSSITKIQELLTFSSARVDLVSIGGIIAAQSGSSGGPVVNVWGKLIGIITTTSDGTTTADRDLRAITLSYIDHDLAVQTGQGLSETLSGDIKQQSLLYEKNTAPELLKLYFDVLKIR